MNRTLKPWVGILVLPILPLLLPAACGSCSDTGPGTEDVPSETELEPYEGDEPGECTDRADNDRDGLFDCDDPGCSGSPDCRAQDADVGDEVAEVDAPDDEDSEPEAPPCPLGCPPDRGFAVRIGGPATMDEGRGIAYTGDMGVVVVGTTNSGGGYYEIFLVKLSPGGDIEWQRRLNFDPQDNMGLDAAALADGTVLVSAWSFPMGEPMHSWVARVGAGGDLLFDRRIAVSGEHTRPGGIAAAADGGFYVLLNANSSILVRFDAAGSMQWSRTLEVDSCGFEAVIEAEEGGTIVAGGCATGPPEDLVFDAVLARVSDDGTAVWGKRFDGGGSERFLRLVEAPGGDIVAYGSLEAEGAVVRLWLVRMNSGGGALWSRIYGSASGWEYPDRNDSKGAMDVTPDGGVIVAATVSNSAPIDPLCPDSFCWHWWMAEIDPAGSIAWQRQLGAFEDMPGAVSYRPDGMILIAGTTASLAEPVGEYVYYDLVALGLRPDGTVGTACQPGVLDAAAAAAVDTPVPSADLSIVVSDALVQITEPDITGETTTAGSVALCPE